MIMRYHSSIPDNQTPSNGRRRWKTGKEDEDGEISTNTTLLEGKGISRFRSQDDEDDEDEGGNNLESSNGGVGGFLQWGHRKRSRCSRGTSLTDETSSSTSTLQQQQPSNPKLQRRLSSSASANANAMPPPSSNGAARGGPNLRTPTKNTPSPSLVTRRNSEDQSLLRSKSPPSNGGGIRARSRVGKRLPTPDKKGHEKLNGGCSSSSLVQNQHQEVAGANHRVVSPPHRNESNSDRPVKVAGEKVSISGGCGGGGNEVNEWPRIFIPLSRKEKEEDFLAMKGTKLPQRPKKRSKTVDRLLQYCFPGMWLSDLTRGRYEVREKKCPKKQQKRRGLKGMENLDISDSE